MDDKKDEIERKYFYSIGMVIKCCAGATTFSRMTLIIMTNSVMTLIKMTHSIMTLIIMTNNVMTLGKMLYNRMVMIRSTSTCSKTTPSITTLQNK
jgi:hypothetical protein